LWDPLIKQFSKNPKPKKSRPPAHAQRARARWRIYVEPPKRVYLVKLSCFVSFKCIFGGRGAGVVWVRVSRCLCFWGVGVLEISIGVVFFFLSLSLSLCFFFSGGQRTHPYVKGPQTNKYLCM